ncbi:MAG: BamA/TamA family outer membrane protein [Acidobacteria bacterium]|nr:BamA/TamA family outer membrane protein [Acidobacteriota bacterium]
MRTAIGPSTLDSRLSGCVWACDRLETAQSFRRAAAVFLALILTLCAGVPSVGAQEEDDRPADVDQSAEAADSETGNGEEEAKKKKAPSFLPIPIFITEPAIGYGLGGALAHFHKKKHETGSTPGALAPALTANTTAKTGKQQKVPPTVSGIAAAYTDKGTWGVGIAHSASWSRDKIRYVGAAGYAHVVSTFYFGDQPFDFELDSGLLYQDIKFRIHSSDFFVGAKLVYLNPELVFDLDLDDVPIEPDKTQLNDFGLAAQADFDGRDNKMTPNRGQFVELVAWKHLEALGGETDYWNASFQVQSFSEMMKKRLVLGFHLALNSAGGDPPLWGYPWITMRGIPALRYQNESTAVLETELRWNILERWAAVGFIGTAATRGDVPVFKDESGIVAGGIGGRFLFRPQDSLWVGIDVAKGPEDYVLYVQVGQAW